MCGIFGFSLGRGLNESEQDFVKRDIINFAKLSLKRGSDTFGINIIVDDWNYVFKSSSNPNSAINRKDYKKFIDNKLVKACKNKKSFNYFGQTRLVTNGTKFLYKNNQPIVTNNIIGLHNGILFFPDENNKDDKTKNYESFNIKSDSLNFFEQLNNAIEKKNKNVTESFLNLVNKVTGNFSIALSHIKESFILISSNCGSLYYYYNCENKIFVYASEKLILESFLLRSNFLKNKKKDNFSGKIIQVKNITCVFDYNINKTYKINNKNYGNNINLNFNTFKEFEIVTNDQENIERLKNLRRCTKCVLPETYPFITFDEDGICNFCKKYNPQIFLGEEKLIEILNFYKHKSDTPNCLIGLSGGRDSCYGLHLLKTKYKMNPVAYTYDWGLTTDISRLNASKLCGKLGVEHIIRSANIEKKRSYIRKNIFAWLKKPHLGMLPIVQAGDKGFMDYGRILSKQLKLKLMLKCSGYQLEQREFFLGFAGINQTLTNNQRMCSYSTKTKLKMFLWYSYQFLINPSYLNSALIDNFNGFLASFIRKEEFLYLYNYIKWEENLMNKILADEYNWISDKSYGLNQ